MSLFNFKSLGEDEYAKAYQYFVTTKDTLELPFLKLLFLGPPHLGKTSLQRRLNGEISDLVSAGEADVFHASTGAVESGPNVVVRCLSHTTAAIIGNKWTGFSALGDEACFLLQTLSSILNSKIQLTKNEMRQASSGNKLSPPTLAGDSSALMPEMSAEQSNAEMTDASIVTKEVKSEVWDEVDIPAIFKEAVKSKYWQDIKHTFKAYIKMEDTGGQPELMDMLPALTVGPGLYLLFFNLQNPLNKPCTLTHCSASGESSLPVQSNYTVKEMFLSALSSISCSNASSQEMKREESVTSELEDILVSSKSVAHLVGTYRDKVKDEDVAELDQQLQEIIRSTSFFEEDIVQFYTEDQLIVPVNNMEGGVKEIKEIRKLLEDCIENQFKKLKIPAVWLVFSLCLRRRGLKIVSIESCLKLSEKLNMSNHETKVALWFLHHHAGIIMYFPNIPELKDIVIIESQSVYDSVTELILSCAKYPNRQAAAERFRKTGMFSMKHLQSISRKVSKDYLPPMKLIALLKYLHIIAYIHFDSKPSWIDDTDIYVMPCMLQNAPVEELDSCPGCTGKEILINPLIIRHKCGFLPIGAFPALIACVIKRNVLKVILNGIKKNCVQFYFSSDYIRIIVIARPTFYEIQIDRKADIKFIHEVCTSVREEIAACLSIVGSQMNYSCYNDYQFAFECPTTVGHLCVIDPEVQSPQKMLCLKECGPRNMLASHSVWYGKVCLLLLKY